MTHRLLVVATATMALAAFGPVGRPSGLAAGAGLSAGQALDASRPISYFIAEAQAGVGSRAGDCQLATWALETWQRAAAQRLRFSAVDESSALIRVYWAGPNSGEYGETRRIVVGGRRGAAVYIRPDMEALGPDIASRADGDSLLRDSIVYLTCLHEIGHALGLDHTSDARDIMYFFGYGGDVVAYFGRYRTQIRVRGDIAHVSGLSSGDVSRLRALYPAN